MAHIRWWVPCNVSFKIWFPFSTFWPFEGGICLIFRTSNNLVCQSNYPFYWIFTCYIVQKEAVELGEFEWLTEMGLFNEQIPQEALAAAEVPQLPLSQSSNFISCRPNKSSMPYKKPRLGFPDDNGEHFTVPDLGWNSQDRCLRWWSIQVDELYSCFH